MGLEYLYRWKTVRILQGISFFAKWPQVLAFAKLAMKILNLVLWMHTPMF